MRPTNSPPRIVRLTSLRTWLEPNHLFSPRMVKSGACFMVVQRSDKGPARGAPLAPPGPEPHGQPVPHSFLNSPFQSPAGAGSCQGFRYCEALLLSIRVLGSVV